jgi:glycosyltransferase involved in cell wall biosynthesis
MQVLLCLPPARTSNEADLFRAMPAPTQLIVANNVVSNGNGQGYEEHLFLEARRVPLVGGQEGWTAAPAWLSGLTTLDPGPVDVVASLELYSFVSWQAAVLARRHGVPHAVTVFETMANNPLYRLPPWRQITRRIVRSAGVFVCFSDLALKHAVELGCPSERCVVVHPGVDTAWFRPAGERPTRPTVLFVGMLRADRGADKGVREIVAACEQLAGEIEGLRLVMVGDGPLRPELSERARAEPFLEVLGRRDRDQIACLLRESSALVLASRRRWKWEEQFGFVLVEAMASGLPVVATRSGAIPEVVPSWNILVAERDVAGLAEGIRAALGPAGDDWGRRNRVHALEHFDLHRQGSRLAATLSGLTASTPGKGRPA